MRWQSKLPIQTSSYKIIRLGLLLGAALPLTSCSFLPRLQPAADPPQRVIVGSTKVEKGDLQRTLRLAAEFRPYQEIDVNAKEAGYVKAIYVDIGDHVKQGALLVVLEIPELQDQVNETRASERKSQQEIQRAQYALAQANASYEATHLDYTRLANVAKAHPELIAQQELDDAMGKDQAAAAQVGAGKAALASAQEQNAVAQANRERVATLFSYARITAPFTGVITRRYADTGAMIQAGTSSHIQAMPVVRLSQNDLLRLDIPVPESVVPLIRMAMTAQVEVPSLGKTFQGKVVRFADKVDFSTRTMDTEIDIKNPKLELVPGMYAYASIVLESKKAVLTVPVQALDREGGKASVDRVNAQGKIEQVPVQLGLETPDRVEVISGLNDGDTVVVSARSQLRPGEEVQPKIVDVAEPRGES